MIDDKVASANKRTPMEARVCGTHPSSSDNSRGSIRWNSSDDMESNSVSTALQLRWVELHVMSKKNNVTSFLQPTHAKPDNNTYFS